MTDNCYIYHHLGLGDHLICNGLVRYLISTLGLKRPCLVVKQSNLNNVQRMFIDQTNLSFCVLKSRIYKDSEFVDYYNQNKAPVIKVGFEECRSADFDKSFYDSVYVPFEERWNSWYIQRNDEQENKLFEELKIDDDYIFIHDQSSVGKYNLKIDSDLRQIRPDKLKCETSIFDWIKVIENAKEIHAISSSFVHLINSLKLNNSLYFHNIKHSDGMFFCLSSQWKIIDSYRKQ